MKSMLVYCGSSQRAVAKYGDTAEALGAELAARGWALVYGGGSTGLMGVVADAVMSRGGMVTGVIPKAMASRELAHHGLTKLHIVDNMHERKAMMLSLADAIIALPGGIGTLEEWAEAMTWLSLGYHTRPCGLLNAHGFYDPLVEQINRMQDDGFLYDPARKHLLVEREPVVMIEALEALVAR